MFKKIFVISALNVCFCLFGMFRTVSPIIRSSTTTTYKEAKPSGRLVVITGPMCAGKSEELIRNINVAKVAELNTIVFKPGKDTRVQNVLFSRGRTTEKIEAFEITKPEEIISCVEAQQKKIHLVAIDEVQFFQYALVNVVKRLVSQGVQVIASGLDMNFKTEPFGPCIPELLAMADDVIKLKAVCIACKAYDATLTQRLVNGLPSRKSDPEILIDDGKSNVEYQPRCRRCHDLPE
jgi:thymidine kinase